MNGIIATRRICPVEVRTLQRLVSTSRMYLVRQVGPSSWDIAEGTRSGNRNNSDSNQLNTVRVSLGAVHQCTCNSFNKTRELCIHLVWILLNKLKLKSSDQLSYQLGMTEAQMMRCLEGRTTNIRKTKDKKTSDLKPTRGKVVPKRPISGRDSCPICLESFANKSVIYCKYSCGNAMHTHCIDIVSKHQDLSCSSSGPEVGITCPLCRGYFCSQYELLLELRKPNNIVKPQPLPLISFELVCALCDITPIVGSAYKCASCPQMIVCPACLNSQAFSIHASHGLVVKTDPKLKWKKTQYPYRRTLVETNRAINFKSNKLVLPKLNKKMEKYSNK